MSHKEEEYLVEEIRWEDIYSNYQDFLGYLGTSTDELATFQDIHVGRIPVLTDGLDWLTKKEVQSLATSFLNYPCLPFWETNTKKGTLHTVQELYKNIGSVEKQSAIWIMASIWDKKKDLRDDWRVDTYRLLSHLFGVILHTFPDISVWYHSCREALPISIGIYYPSLEFIHPQTHQHFIYLSAVETSIILANWQLVRFVP
jgi:hypothetical protein